MFYEHFGLDVYGVELPIRSVTNIVDLGANIGFSTIALASRYPNARFVCVEPFEESRLILEQNLARNGVDAIVLGLAVVGEPGRYRMTPQRHPAANRVRLASDGRVDGITLETLLDRAGIGTADLVKIDVEGAELGIFGSANAWAPRVKALIGELHNGLTSDDADRLLSPHGFVALPLPDRERFRGLVCFINDSIEPR